MIWAIVAVLYFTGVTVTATLLYLHIQDNPGWMVSKTSTTPQEDQLVAAGGASILFPVTLVVYTTIAARRWWICRCLKGTRPMTITEEDT